MPFVPGQQVADLPPAVRVKPDESIAQSTSMFQQPLGEAEKAANEEADLVNNAKATQAYGALVKLKNDLSYGENGFMNKLGENAMGITGQFTPAWEQGVSDITKNLTGPQKLLVMPAIKNEGMEFQGLLAKHEHQQRQDYFVGQSDYLIKNLQQDAIVNYPAAPDKLDISLNSQMAQLGKKGDLLGWDKDKLTEEGRKLVDDTYGPVINNLLMQGNYKEAQKLFDGHKGWFSPDALPKIQSSLRQGAIFDQSADMWQQFNTRYRLQNGGININRIQSDVQNLENFTPQEKLEIASRLKGLAYEDSRNRQIQKADQMDSFMDWAYKARSGGMPYDQATKQLVGKYGQGDTVDYVQKQKILQEVYGPPKESDTQTWLYFQDKLANKEPIDTQQLDDAFQKYDKLSEADYRKITVENAKNLKTGVSDPKDKFADQAVNAMATNEFRDDPQAKANFLRTVDAQGLTGPTKQDWAARALKQDQEGNIFSKTPIDWKLESQKLNTQLDEFDHLNMAMGPGVVNALGRSILHAKGNQGHWTAPEVVNLVENLGGFDQIKPGTQKYNAIMALSAEGYPINEISVSLYLLKHPQGQ